MAQLREAITVAADDLYAQWIESGRTTREMFEVAVTKGVHLARAASPPRVSGLTARQRELLRFIEGYVDQHGYSPSYDEMMDALGLLSKSGINRMIVGLERRGAIERMPGQGRSINILAKSFDVQAEPLT